MKNLALLLITFGALALQGCSDDGPSPVPGPGSSSAASSDGPASKPLAERGLTIMHSELCAGCHVDEGNGVFSGAAPFDVNNLEKTPIKNLFQYIRDKMPIDNEEACGVGCARAVEAYLRSFYIEGASSSSSSVPASSVASSVPSSASSSSASASSVTSMPASSSSSSSAGTEFTGNAESGVVLFVEQGCAACHADNKDGTFGRQGPFFFDMNNLVYPGESDYSETVEGLAEYIAEQMPPASFGLDPAVCAGECADDIAAYLWGYREAADPAGSASSSSVASTSSASSSSSSVMPPVSSSSSSSSASSSVASSSASPVASSSSSAISFTGNAESGELLFAEEGCAACHADNMDGTFGRPGPFFFDVNSLVYPGESDYSETVEGLAAYIAEQMPPAAFGLNPASCEGQCADDIAAYIWSYRNEDSSSSSSVASSSSSEAPSSSSSSSASSSEAPASSSSSSSASSVASSSSVSSSSSSAPAMVEEGKALVEDIQRLSAALNSSSQDTLGAAVAKAFDGETAVAVEGFLNQLVNSEFLRTGGQIGYALEALGKAGGSIADVLSSEIGDEPIPTDLEVAVMLTTENVGQRRIMTFVVDQTINVCTEVGDVDQAGCNVIIDLVVVADFEFAPTGSKSETGSTLASDGLAVDIQGSIRNDFVVMGFEPPAVGSAIAVSRLRLNMDQPESGSSTVFALVRDLVMSLPVTLREAQSSSPVSVDLLLTGTGDAITLNYASEAVEEGAVTTTTHNVDVTALTNINADLTSIVTNANGESMTTSVDVLAATAGAGTSGVIKSVENCESANGCTISTTFTADEQTSDSAVGFLAALIPGLSASVDLSALLAGVDPIAVDLAGAPQADDVLHLEGMQVAYGDVDYTVTGDFGKDGEVISLDATNEAGVRIVVESDAGGTRSGFVYDSLGTQVGVVTESADGALLITYNDGSTSSL